MKIAPTRRYMFALESVAMTDIVMNMFIFFFISFSLLYTFSPDKAKQIKVNLPQAKHVMNPGASAGFVNITLSAEGPLYLEGEVVTYADLETRLSRMKASRPDLTVVVHVDRLAPFKNVVRVLDTLNGLGIERLRIAAQEEK
ncbi:MAG: biopolymer transporter ExbD [Candidatus Omnitrophota bacterium]